MFERTGLQSYGLLGFGCGLATDDWQCQLREGGDGFSSCLYLVILYVYNPNIRFMESDLELQTIFRELG